MRQARSTLSQALSNATLAVLEQHKADGCVMHGALRLTQGLLVSDTI
jgi:hypothetical protein